VKQLAPDVWQLKGRLPLPNAINTYLVGDVLIDSGARFDGKVILSELRGRDVNAHALTHAHGDHQGSSKLVCDTLGVPYWVPENDADKAEDPKKIRAQQPDALINTLFFKTMAGPGRPVDRRLRESDEVGGFTVLDTPGHSRGHASYWREPDRTLILGDVLANLDIYTGIPGLGEPKKAVTPDPARNRESIRRLGELEPALVLFGHGAPLRDTARFVSFCRAVG
jgi:hydroxyacylglutathione hydrolase